MALVVKTPSKSFDVGYGLLTAVMAHFTDEASRDAGVKVELKPVDKERGPAGADFVLVATPQKGNIVSFFAQSDNNTCVKVCGRSWSCTISGDAPTIAAECRKLVIN